MFQEELGFDKAFPWIAAATSNNMKRLNTQRIKLATRPTTYRNNKVRAREAEVLENCEADRIVYQEKVFGTRTEIFRHLKYINKEPRIPKTVEYKEESASTTQSKAELFNSFFHTVFAPKAPLTVNRYQNQKAKLQNFKVSVGIIEFFRRAWYQEVPGPQQSTVNLLQSNKEINV